MGRAARTPGRHGGRSVRQAGTVSGAVNGTAELRRLVEAAWIFSPPRPSRESRTVHAANARWRRRPASACL